MRSFAHRPAALASTAESNQAALYLCCVPSHAPRRRYLRVMWPSATQSFSNALLRQTAQSSLLSAVVVGIHRTSAHTTSLSRFSTSSGTYEVINPAEIAFMDTAATASTDAKQRGNTDQGETVSFESSLAWSMTQSRSLPSAFVDVEHVDPFARPRMLGFVRRHHIEDLSGDVGSNGSNGSADAAFVTEELLGGAFHARLCLPVTPAGARFLGCDSDDTPGAKCLWAHGVANTAKDAELLAAMHAERMADLLGYHLYSLPSKQRKHAEVARQAGRYASTPDDRSSGPSAQERREQWPLPLRRVLTDEETEGGKWQLVDTSAAATRFLCPDHTLLSPCMLDPNSRVRIEARFGGAPSGCPSFAQQLSVERVRTLTASSVAEGGSEFMVAQLALPPELTTLATPIMASGKAVDRATAVLLACMHAELLLDTLHIPLFDDPAKQCLHSAAAWSFGRPAPIAGAKPKNPSHMHLPDPLKQLVVSGPTGQRTSMRSAEEEYFHLHDIITEQTGTFVETSVGESTAVAVLSRFLEAHHAPRATAAFLQTSVAGRVKSTVLLPLPESYGIRGGVGIASNARDADTLAAMHALDVLCMLNIPVTVGESDLAVRTDAAWKAARRERIPDVPATVSDVATPSPPARRCSAKTFTSVISVDVGPLAAASKAALPTSPTSSSHSSAGVAPTARRRVAKRAQPSPGSAAPSFATDCAQGNAESTPSAQAAPSSLPRTPQEEAAECEARLSGLRSAIDPELWNLTADSPDGYLMISPGAQQASAVAEYAIVSPRKLDKQAKSRIIEYLSTVGRRLDDVLTKQALDENDTEGRPRHRCALKLPLPSACGEPRLALGEADTIADAEHAACMHAELLLDALGVCMFSDAVKQLRHAEACAQWGRWAPSGPGQEKPPTTPSPPPLRREHVGSLHWERKKTKKGAGFAAQRPIDETPKTSKTEVTAEREKKSLGETEIEDDTKQYDYVEELDIDPVARTRVQYFLRHERLTAGAMTNTTFMGRGVLTHVVAWDLPLPARLRQETVEGAVAQGSVSYAVKGAASTRKDAEALSWMHAERLLDAVDIPIFPNLPQLQAYHAAEAEKKGRHAPKLTCDPSTPLPAADSLPIKPLRLQTNTRRFNVSRPVPLTPAEAASEQLWEKYITACDAYITATQYAANNLFFAACRVPRTGDAMIDAALAEAEAAPLDRQSRTLLLLYANACKCCSPRQWTVRMAGEPHQRVYYATIPIPGFEYVVASGVGQTKFGAHLRGAMHALAILRRIDPNYEDTYSAAKMLLVLNLNKLIDDERGSPSEDLDDFNLDAFSTLPSITSEAQRVDNMRARRFRFRMHRLFARDVARSKANETALSEDGKRRAVELYALCCGVSKPVERSLVRLMPRHEEASEVAPVMSSSELKLEVKVESASDEDAKVRRVRTGATYATSVSLTDEDGHEWSARGDGFGPNDNQSAAYDKLYDALVKDVPVMRKLTEILQSNSLLRVEDVPSLKVPVSVSERIQACLRNQKDLLQTESETGALDTQKLDEAFDKRWKLRQSYMLELQERHGSEVQREPEESEKAALIAAESASLLERLQQRITNPVYLEKYALKRARLSIAEHQAEILQCVRSNSVVIICGTTGCGKTTQIPQYILDAVTQEGRGGSCHVLVTQPRRLSALSIARRVAEERLETIGQSTGYIIRFDSHPGQHITFVTPGVLLRLLRAMPTLPEYTHIIIDEIHERDLFTDFLLVLLRDLVAQRPDLRLILMSATLQASEFQRYFNDAPLIQVYGYAFPVKELFVEDLVPFAREHQRMTPLLMEVEATASSSESSSERLELPQLPPSSLTAAQTAAEAGRGLFVDCSSPLCYDVLEVTSPLDFQTVRFAVEQATRMIDLSDSSILVFLPGWTEIKLMQQLLERNPAFYILPLHSALGQEAQLRCFLPAPPGKTKVILSTNIAESGVTIDDVAVVIDCGRVKEKSFATRTRVVIPRAKDTGYDYCHVTDNSRVTKVVDDNVRAQDRFSQLLEVWASRANCVQRRGRVGRTRPGVCIRLYSREHFERLHHYQTPEMLRTALDQLCLTVLALRVGTPAEFLSRALEPPLESEVSAALRRLTALGAVTTEGQLTALGHRLSQLPMEPETGKMLLLGVALNCLDSALTLAATSEGDVFVSSRDERTAVRLHREDLSMGTFSDSLASVNAYNFWATSTLSKTPVQLAEDLKNRCLSVPNLLRCSRLKHHFFALLVDSGIVPLENYKAIRMANASKQHVNQVFIDTSDYSRNALDVGLMKAIIAAGHFPKIALLAGRAVMRMNFENFIQVSSDSVVQKSDCQPTFNPFFVYGELKRYNEVKTLRCGNLTMVSLWALLFMGDRQMPIDYIQDLSLCVMDGWIFFRVSLRELEQIRKFKALFDRRLSRKFTDPEDSVNNAQLEVICGILSDLMNTSFYPSPMLFPTMLWGEAGTIIAPNVNKEVNFADDGESSPQDEFSDEEGELE